MTEKTQKKFSFDEMREILCAPKPTDTLEEIGFDDPGFDEASERDFVRSWLESETKGYEWGLNRDAP